MLYVRLKGISTPRIIWSKEEKINSGLLHDWIQRYLNDGEKGLESKIKPRNLLVKCMYKKQLTDIGKLECVNIKLRIENERLKKVI